MINGFSGKQSMARTKIFLTFTAQIWYYKNLGKSSDAEISPDKAHLI
ncbi:MAG: hypothetical protein ABIP06_10210 [Pyrinomonadaceae bacterium]